MLPDSEEELALTLIELAKRGPEAQGELDVLIEVATDPKQPKAASIAVHAIGQIGAEAIDTVPMLSGLLDQYREHKFGRTVAKALGAIGPAASDAIPALNRAKHSDNRCVRKAAREALGKISLPNRSAT